MQCSIPVSTQRGSLNHLADLRETQDLGHEHRWEVNTSGLKMHGEGLPRGSFQVGMENINPWKSLKSAFYHLYTVCPSLSIHLCSWYLQVVLTSFWIGTQEALKHFVRPWVRSHINSQPWSSRRPRLNCLSRASYGDPMAYEDYEASQVEKETILHHQDSQVRLWTCSWTGLWKTMVLCAAHWIQRHMRQSNLL